MIYILGAVFLLLVIILGYLFFKYTKLREINDSINIASDSINSVLDKKLELVNDLLSKIKNDKIKSKFEYSDDYSIYEKENALFNVSFDMTLNRLESLGIIDSNQKLRLDNEKIEKKVGNLLRNSGGNARLNVASKEINIPYEYIDYAIYNYNHNAIPQETLEKVLNYYHLSMEDISDKLITYSYDDDDNLEDLIGGLDD